MRFYPAKISEKFNSAKNAGAVIDADGSGTSATFVCGAVVRFTLRIDGATKEITDAKYKTSGCGYLIAAAETLSEQIVGAKLTGLHGLDCKFLETEIETKTGAFPEQRKHCLNTAAEALQNAFADFRRAQIEEWAGEQALICTCFGVSEETIETAVERGKLETVGEVTDVCSAGGGCGSCQPLIQEIIDQVWHERIQRSF